MRLGAIIYILGYGGAMLAMLMLLPLVVSIGMEDNVHAPNFTIGFFLTAFVSGAMILTGRAARRFPAQKIELFFIMILVWGALPWLASIPMTGALQVFDLSDAYFEAVSALTTSGGTVMKYPELETVPILLWRALLSWLGGLWMLVFAVSVLAPLGIGGLAISGSPLLQLSDKASLSMRLGQPLRLIFPIYVSLTILGVIALVSTGAGFFASLSVVLSAISSTGFVTHSSGIASQFNQAGLAIIAVTSFTGALSAPVLVLLGVGKRLQTLSKDTELRVFLVMILAYAGLSFALLKDLPFATALMQSVSLFSTTGFNFMSNSQLQSWPVVWVMVPVLIGGMALSAAGGVKVMRAIVLAKGIGGEFSRLSYPASVHPVMLDGRRLEPNDFSAIWAYSAVFCSFLGLGILATGLFGVALADSWPIVLGALTNSLSITTGLDLAVPFGSMSSNLQFMLALLMIAGRVEILILLVFFTSSFWRYVR